MDRNNYFYKAKLIRVLDGDTIDANIDLGFDVNIQRRIRLWGIDAAETRTKNLQEKADGLKVRDRLEQLINSNDNTFYVRSLGIDKYGRCLGEIYIQDININKQLLAEGLVKIYKSKNH